ncbi:hypothetical protein JCM10049v2_001355 [Rhodotorula toruloides]
MSGSRGVEQGVYTADSRRDAILDEFVALVLMDPEGVGAFISSLDKRPPESWPAYFASLKGPRPPPDPAPSHAPDPATDEADDAMDWATTPEQINSLDNAIPLTNASPATPSSSPSRSPSSSPASSSSPSPALSAPAPRTSHSRATITPGTEGGATNEREKDGMEVDDTASDDQRVAGSAGTSPQHVLPPASKRQEEKQQLLAKKRKREPSPSSSSSSSSSSPTTQQSTSSKPSASLLQPASLPASSTPSTSTSTPPQVPTPAAPPAPTARPSTVPLVLPSFRRLRPGEVDSLNLDFLNPRRVYAPSEEVPIRPPPPKVTPNFIPSRFIRRGRR